MVGLGVKLVIQGNNLKTVFLLIGLIERTQLRE